MSKRFKYFISSLLSTVGFFFFVSLPYESHYYGLLVGIVLITFCFWFGLGIIFDKSFYIRIMSVILPVGFFIGFGLFAALLPLNTLSSLILSVFFGSVCYIMFLTENVFMVAIGYRTPPLYRAAYTVSLILLLVTSFFLFDSLYSYMLSFWMNTIFVFLISMGMFLYQYWVVTIELSDDGKEKNIWSYTLIPALLISELALVFSFWPVGIFKGSIYLVSVIYVVSGLLQADIRERLFRRIWLSHLWIAIAIVVGIVFVTRWR